MFFFFVKSQRPELSVSGGTVKDLGQFILLYRMDHSPVIQDLLYDVVTQMDTQIIGL